MPILQKLVLVPRLIRLLATTSDAGAKQQDKPILKEEAAVGRTGTGSPVDLPDGSEGKREAGEDSRDLRRPSGVRFTHHVRPIPEIQDDHMAG
jgi:hypothetical protein